MQGRTLGEPDDGVKDAVLTITASPLSTVDSGTRETWIALTAPRPIRRIRCPDGRLAQW